MIVTEAKAWLVFKNVLYEISIIPLLNEYQKLRSKLCIKLPFFDSYLHLSPQDLLINFIEKHKIYYSEYYAFKN